MKDILNLWPCKIQNWSYLHKMEKEYGKADEPSSSDDKKAPKTNREIGGRKGLDPTRYGDWEKNGRCIDF